MPHAGTVLVTGAVCSILPDADVIAFGLGVPYDDMLGHRGRSHSIFFALGLSILAVVPMWSRYRAGDRAIVALFFFLATASHGVLDALTNGGLGAAFFAPLSARRYFFPWRPIVVSPIGIHHLFSEWGVAVIGSEITFVWLPAAVLATAGILIERRRHASV